MSDTKNIKTINSRLIEHLFTIPFPYSDILKEQIYASTFTNTIFPDYYCIHFKLEKRAKKLPHWVDTMPLSWQVLTDEAPLLCQLFIKEGYIEKLEIINLALSDIEWEKIWAATPLLDFEYSIQFIKNYFVAKEVVISKVLHVGSHIDLALESDNSCFVASFRDCKVRKLVSDDIPKQHLLRIEELNGVNLRFAVSSCNGDIDFDCALMFIQWHKRIG